MRFLSAPAPLAGHSPMRGSPLAAETLYFDLPRDLTSHNLGSARLLLRPGDQDGPLTYTHTVTFVNVYKVRRAALLSVFTSGTLPEGVR